MIETQCPVCLDSTSASVNHANDIYNIDCNRCGHFRISYENYKNFSNQNTGLGQHGSRERTNASAWIYENQGIELNQDDEQRLIELQTPSFHQRADKLLKRIEKETKYAGQLVNINLPKWLSKAWCVNSNELIEVLKFLVKNGRLGGEEPDWHFTQRRLNQGDAYFSILPDGWAHLEKLREINPESLQGFVAMWFDKEMDSVFQNGFVPALENAGYRPIRIDRKEHVNKIDDEIITEIRRSRFLVADFTGQRGGVYFEAGFAFGLGFPVVWTCRKDQINELHFDIRQYNCIDWVDPEDLKVRLQRRIEASLGKGDWTRNG